MAQKLKKPITWLVSLAVMLTTMFVLLPIITAADETTVGAFTVTGGTENADYSYADNVLTISTDTALTISSTATTTDTIMVDSTSGANITLAGVNIDVSGKDAVALSVDCYSATITLADGTENFLTSGGANAGIEIYHSIDTPNALVIQGNGALTATGGSDGGAGIGSAESTIPASIHIKGGVITAVGGSGAAGIGGGNDVRGDKVSSIIISGGYVKAIGGSDSNGCKGADIGGGVVNGVNGEAVTPTDVNGNDLALMTISTTGVNAVTIDGKSCLNMHGTDSEIYVYLPKNKLHTVSLDDDTNTMVYSTSSGSWVKMGSDLVAEAINSGETLTYGTDYTYESGVLTVLSNKAVTIKNNSSAATTDIIVVASADGANVTLNGVNIDVSAKNTTCAFKIDSSVTGNVTITLADGSTNVLKSGGYRAGLQKSNGDDYNLEITGGANDTGTLTATGGYLAAGIGGAESYAGANIKISGGIVTANGGKGGAGIGGGGNGGTCSDITISGGSVKAKGGVEDFTAANIGNGNASDAHGASVTPTNSEGKDVYLLEIANTNSETVKIDGVEYTPVNHKAADSTDTNLYAYLTGECHTVKVGSTTKVYELDSLNSVFVEVELGTQLSITADYELVYGKDYTYPQKTGVLTVLTDKAVTIKNIDSSTATTTDTIVVDSASGANITLNGVNIDVSGTGSTLVTNPGKAPIHISENTGDVTITLADSSVNTLKGGYSRAALQKENTEKLEITGTGTLNATGGHNAAGIGGGRSDITSYRDSITNITINDGVVNASGGLCGAGIGGGYMGSASYIAISGGTITAVGNYAAGIGGGDFADGNHITISGGTVNASSQFSGAGIGGGEKGNGTNITINGSAKVIATGGEQGAGIGGGLAMYDSGENKYLGGKGDNITIGGSAEVTATGGEKGAGIGGGYIGDGTNITIGDSAAVTATGGANAAGIGGGYMGSGKDITIKDSAVVVAKGGENGAGIGGGKFDNDNSLKTDMGGEGSGIAISGSAVVTATGGKYGAGIGGGYKGVASDITIDNTGSVKASGGEYGKAIGGGFQKAAVTPTNGTEYVYLLELDTTGATAVTINGKSYPTKHGTEDKIYVYLPAKTAAAPNEITVDEKTTRLFYNTTAKKWLIPIDIPAEDETVFTYTGEPQTYALVTSEYYTISDNTTQTNAGTYEITISLIDTDIYAWSDGTTDDLIYEFKINKAPVPTYDDIEVSYVYTTTGLQSITNITLPSFITPTYSTRIFTESDENGILAKYPNQPTIKNGKIRFTLNENTADKIGSTATICFIVSKMNYEEIHYRVVITLTDKIEKSAPSLDDFTLDFTVDGNNNYTATINTDLTGVEYSFDGITWSDVNTKTDIAHVTEVTAYIRYAETDTQYASAAVSKTATTAHGNLTHHDAVPKRCLEDGSIEYWTCDACGKYYSNADGTTEITQAQTIDAHIGHVCDNDVWAKDGTGHWHACANCTEKVDFAAHISGGAATPDTAETCTICGYEINPKTGYVAAPVITPNGGTFSGTQEVTITCATEGATIYYTTDGSVPTKSSAVYTEAFTISKTTTIKAFAVKDGMADSEVVTVKFTKKSSGGSGGGTGGGGGSSNPTPSKPEINGKSADWATIASEIANMTANSEITIELNGNYDVPVEVIKAIADKNIKATFVIDSWRSWKLNGAEISAPMAADLKAIQINSLTTSVLRGTVGIQFRLDGTNTPTKFSVSFKADFAGKFANLYKLDGDKLVFVDVVKVDESGNALLPVADKGDYVIMLSDFSDLSGDMDNDGKLTAADATATLKYVVNLISDGNILMADLDGDGKITARDALITLRKVVGLE